MFLIHTVDDGHVPPLEYQPAAAITPKQGLALQMVDGKLLMCTGASKPNYICMQEGSTAVAAGTLIPVIRVTPDIVFETRLNAYSGTIDRGSKVTIAADGLRVTGTTGSGVAEIVSMDGRNGGDKVRVRFA